MDERKEAVTMEIIVSIGSMLVVQTGLWLYKFGKLEQKVTDQNGRLKSLEGIRDKQLTKGG